MPEHDLIERYLDRLAETLRGPGSEIRRALAESEDHLREAEAAEIASGRSEQVAAAAAIERFGTVEEVARRYDLKRATATPGQIVAQIVFSLMLVGAFILISIGLSGILAVGAGALFGQGFIAGDIPGTTYTPERCADFYEYHPEADNCQTAAIAHHFDETVSYRMAAGVLGVIVLGLWWAGSRTVWRSRRSAVVPVVFVPVASTALFAAAAFLFGGLGLGQLATSGTETGAGSFLTAATVSLLAAIGFGIWLVRSLQGGSRER